MAGIFRNTRFYGRNGFSTYNKRNNYYSGGLREVFCEN